MYVCVMWRNAYTCGFGFCCPLYHASQCSLMWIERISCERDRCNFSTVDISTVNQSMKLKVIAIQK